MMVSWMSEYLVHNLEPAEIGTGNECIWQKETIWSCNKNNVQGLTIEIIKLQITFSSSFQAITGGRIESTCWLFWSWYKHLIKIATYQAFPTTKMCKNIFLWIRVLFKSLKNLFGRMGFYELIWAVITKVIRVNRSFM